MKNKKIRIIKYTITIGGVLLLTVAAFIMPKAIYSFYDSQMIGKEEKFEMETVAYEKEGSFEDQLKSFCLCINESDRYKMSAVHMEERNSSISNEELTDIVNNELTNFLPEYFISDMENFTLSSPRLVRRDLYTVYITVPEDEDGRDSITLWLLDYKTDNEMFDEIEILIDMEYHKIYDVWIFSDNYGNTLENYGEVSVEVCYDSGNKKYMEKPECFTEKIQLYYGIEQLYEMYIYEQSYFEDVSGKYDRDIQNESLESFGIDEAAIEDEIDKGLYWLPVVEVYGKNERGGYKRIGIDKIRDILQL